MLLCLVSSFSPFALPSCCGRREILGKAARMGRGMGQHGRGPGLYSSPLQRLFPVMLSHHRVLLLFQPGPRGCTAPWTWQVTAPAASSREPRRVWPCRAALARPEEMK